MTGDALIQAIATVVAAIIAVSLSSSVTNNRTLLTISFFAGAFLGFTVASLWSNFSPGSGRGTPTPGATSVVATITPVSQPLINLTQGGFVAKVEASSTFPFGQGGCYSPRKVIDGIAEGDSDDSWGGKCNEWASDHEKEGAKITITFSKAVMIEYIELYDRPNTKDQIMDGNIQFDGGAPILVGPLPDKSGSSAKVNVGKVVKEITFTVTRVKRNVEGVDDKVLNTGLSEIVVIGPAYQP